MAQLTTYTAVGNKEDLSNIIKNVSPDDTVIFTNIGETTVDNTYTEWLEEALRDAKSNKHVEGSANTADAPTHRARKGNRTQIMKQSYAVSKTQEAVLKAGIKSEIGRAMLLAMKELAKDVEYAFINNSAPVAGNASTARELGGLDYLITTNVNGNATARPLTETLFNDVIESIWSVSSKVPDLVVTSGKNKRNISKYFTGIPNLDQNVDASKKAIIAGIDFYQSDFGVVKILASTQMPNSKIYFLRTEFLETGWLRRFKQEDDPVAADSIQKTITGELTLINRAEKSCGILKDLNGNAA